MFTKPLTLVDLASIQDEELRKSAQDHIRGISLLMALKHAFDRNLQAFFEQTLLSALIQLDKVADVDEVVDIIYYLANESNFLDKERFWAALYGKFSEKTEGKMATIVQQIEERGVEKGIEKGIEKVAKRLLDERRDLSENDLIEWVNKMTGLPEDKIRELKKSH